MVNNIYISIIYDYDYFRFFSKVPTTDHKQFFPMSSEELGPE